MNHCGFSVALLRYFYWDCLRVWSLVSWDRLGDKASGLQDEMSSLAVTSNTVGLLVVVDVETVGRSRSAYERADRKLVRVAVNCKEAWKALSV